MTKTRELWHGRDRSHRRDHRDTIRWVWLVRRPEIRREREFVEEMERILES
jgi:hypothetical protein